MNILDLRANVLWEKYHPRLGEIKFGVGHILPVTFLPLIVFGIFLIFILLLARLIFRIRKTLREPSVLLELTPPAITEKTAYTTKNFFSVIHRSGNQKSFLDKLLGKKTTFSFEIVSTQNQGIRYFIRTTPSQVNNIKHHILSYLPSVSVKTVNEYLPGKNLDKYKSKVIEFAQTKHFAYPLEKQDTLDEHDPVAYITGMMTKLSPGELISFQMIITPTKTKQTDIIKNMILRGEDVLKYLNKTVAPSYLGVFSMFIQLIGFLLGSIFNTLGWAFNTVLNDAVDARGAARQAQNRFQMQYYMNTMQQTNLRPARVITPFEEKAIQSVGQKIGQDLFQARIRLLMVVKDKKELVERERGFLSSLAVFSGESEQSLKKKFNLPVKLMNDYLLLNFRKRLLSFTFNSCPTLLSASEVSDLYHFPYTRVTQTENIAKIHSKELPAPISLKKDPKEFDVVFAQNTYGGQTTMIGLTKEQRIRHQYIIGATGSGKSYTAKVEILRQLMQGTKVIVVDPEREYKQLAASVNGTYIKLSAKSKEKINPFDFSMSSYSGENDLSEHIQDLTEIISLIVGGLSAEEKAVIDKAIIQTYKGHGFSLNYTYYSKAKRSTRGRKPKERKFPLLKDFYKTLKDMRQKDLCNRLEKFTKGSLASVFDSQTNIELNNRLIIFDIKDLTESLRQIMMLVVANFVQNQVKSSPQKRMLIIDEGWMLLQHEESARFISGLVRRARKYYLGVTIISQQANDFLSQEYGRAIASQSSLRILMRQDTTTIKKVADEFKLSEYEEHFLLTCDKGEALIIADQNHVAVKVVASEKEHPLLTTNPKEIYF